MVDQLRPGRVEPHAQPGFLGILDHSGPAWDKNLLVRRTRRGQFYTTTRVAFQPVSNFPSAGLGVGGDMAGARIPADLDFFEVWPSITP